MAVNLTVQGVTYRYPTSNNEQWGTDATDWAIAVTDALASAVVEGDLAPPTASQAVIANDQSVAADVTGLSFDSSVTRAAIVHYYIYRNQNSTELMEAGTLILRYKGSTWTFSQEYQGDVSGVTLSIVSGGANDGKIQYTSSDMGGTPTNGVMKYRAFALPKES